MGALPCEPEHPPPLTLTLERVIGDVTLTLEVRSVVFVAWVDFDARHRAGHGRTLQSMPLPLKCCV